MTTKEKAESIYVNTIENELENIYNKGFVHGVYSGRKSEPKRNIEREKNKIKRWIFNIIEITNVTK